MAGCRVSSSSVCRAEERTNPAFHVNMLRPHNRRDSGTLPERLCCGRGSAVVLVQRPDPGSVEKASAKGNWEFFKMKAPICEGWPLWGGWSTEVPSPPASFPPHTHTPDFLTPSLFQLCFSFTLLLWGSRQCLTLSSLQ